MLRSDKEVLKHQYAERHALIEKMGKKAAYEQVLTQVCQLSAPFPTSLVANPHGCWVSL